METRLALMVWRSWLRNRQMVEVEVVEMDMRCDQEDSNEKIRGTVELETFVDKVTEAFEMC